MASVFQKLLRKKFAVELKDCNAYTTAKDFKMANTADILAAIDRYCEENHHQVTYLSADTTVFVLDGRETYKAELLLGRGSMYNSYYIWCTQVIE